MVRRVSMNEAKPGIETVNERAQPDALAQQLARAAKSSRLAVNRDWDDGAPHEGTAERGHSPLGPRDDSGRSDEGQASFPDPGRAAEWPAVRSPNTSARAGMTAATED